MDLKKINSMLSFNKPLNTEVCVIRMDLDFMEFILGIKDIKDGTYVINLDQCGDVGTYWSALYVLYIEIIYFDSFGIEYIPEEKCVPVAVESQEQERTRSKKIIKYFRY